MAYTIFTALTDDSMWYNTHGIDRRIVRERHHADRWLVKAMLDAHGGQQLGRIESPVLPDTLAVSYNRFRDGAAVQAWADAWIELLVMVQAGALRQAMHVADPDDDDLQRIAAAAAACGPEAAAPILAAYHADCAAAVSPLPPPAPRWDTIDFGTVRAVGTRLTVTVSMARPTLAIVLHGGGLAEQITARSTPPPGWTLRRYAEHLMGLDTDYARVLAYEAERDARRTRSYACFRALMAIADARRYHAAIDRLRAAVLPPTNCIDSATRVAESTTLQEKAS